MADISQLEAALIKADAANDVEGARALAGEIRRMRSQPAKEPAPSNWEQMKSGAWTGLKFGGLLGAGLGAIPGASKALDEAAYEAGGKVTDVAGKVLPASTAAALGFATNVGMQAVPALVGGVGGRAAAPVVEGVSRRLMTSALKPTLAAHQTGKADRAITTMLDEGLNVSGAGVARARVAIDDLNGQIRDRIQNSTAVIDADRAASRTSDLALRTLNAPSANADLATIRGTTLDWLNHPLVRQHGGQLPIQVAQDLKTGAYQTLGDRAYGMGLRPAAERDTYKAITRGLKEEIAAAEPAVAPLNAREGDIINALNLMQRRVRMEDNTNPFGLGLLSHRPAALAAWMLDRSGAAKSSLARLLHNNAEAIPEGVLSGILATGQAAGALSRERR